MPVLFAGHRPNALRGFSAVALIFVLQSLFLPCLCAKGTAKMAIGIGVDLLVLGRVLLAKLRKETNRDWIVYLILAASSVIWISAVANDW